MMHPQHPPGPESQHHLPSSKTTDWGSQIRVLKTLSSDGVLSGFLRDSSNSQRATNCCLQIIPQTLQSKEKQLIIYANY